QRDFFLNIIMKNASVLKIKKEVVQKELKSYAFVLLGSLALSLAYALLIIPHDIVPGGILGLSIVIKKLTGISVGLIAMLINIPLLVWGSKVLGAKTGIKTLFSMVLVSFYIDLITTLTGGKIFIDDILISSVFGGIIIGAAVAIVMNAGAT